MIDTIIGECKFSYYFGNEKEKYKELLTKNHKIMILINKNIYSFLIKNIEIFLEVIKYNNDNLLEWILNFLKEERNTMINEGNQNNKLTIEKIKDINLDKNNYNSIMPNILIKQIQKNKKDIIKIIDIYFYLIIILLNILYHFLIPF